MSKWLSTGEMMDELFKREFGTEAENQDGYKVKVALVGILEQSTLGKLELSGYVLNSKWRILPNYVSFEEAMKAIREGKIVAFHHNGNKFNAGYKGVPEWFKMFTWGNLIDGNWTIENV